MADTYFEDAPLTHNPDVLMCLANLSNDEVFTPPNVANAVLDMLPQEIWSDENTTFLDPVAKSGVFLREIARRLYRGLADKFPDPQERIDHILHHQVFGIAITEVTALMSRRSVYCSKFPNGKYSASRFDDIEGNVRFRATPHTWRDGRCVYCGASESEYGEDRREWKETHAYEFIHTTAPERIFNMKFDVIIGNPPYQLSDGGGNGKSAIPLYNKFIEQAIKLNPRFISMIVPARWYGGGKGLDSFREMMLSGGHIRELVDFTDSSDCFSGVDIAGGVCYFLWDRDRKGDCTVTNHHHGSAITTVRPLNEFDIFVRHGEAIKIIHKITKTTKAFMDSMVYPRRPFGIDSNYSGKSGNIKVRGANGTFFIDRSKITSGTEMIDKYKVIISKVSAEHAGQSDKNGMYRVLSIVDILEPGTVSTETYLIAGVFNSIYEAKNLITYIKSIFFRFLLQLQLFSHNISRERFSFVPVQDFSKPWTDAELYQKYGLNDDEIAFIESMIKPMDVSTDTR